MDLFVEKHKDLVLGSLVCFDRVIFKGHLPLNWPGAIEGLMAKHGWLIKQFKEFVQRESEIVKQHAQGMAQRFGRPYEFLRGKASKEKLAREIAARDGVTEGLICVFSVLEPCSTFRVIGGKTRPQIARAQRNCLCLYYYFLDRDLGFLHVRIQTWFPFTVQVYLNGHDWLARQMDRHGLHYQQMDNAFLTIDDPRQAQKLADQFAKKKWPRILKALARKVNPLLGHLLRGMEYYWVVDQAEYATDILFRDHDSLKPLYDQLLKHAILCFSAEDILTFLGRKLHGGFAGEVLSDHKRRLPGARIKHWMKENWIKLYDKFGSVLRVETVINNPYEFRVLRYALRHGNEVLGWFPMAKGVSNLKHYVEVARAANGRYLNALAVVNSPLPAQEALEKFAQPVRRQGRSYRGFNPALKADVRLLAAVLRGEHAIRGFRNGDIRKHLFPNLQGREETRRRSAEVSRMLKRLHVHGLIAKIRLSRRWRVTDIGYPVLVAMVTLHRQTYPDVLARQAA